MFLDVMLTFKIKLLIPYEYFLVLDLICYHMKYTYLVKCEMYRN